jgi:DNA (cytosine-5)-methyltransferase 1
MNIFELLNEKYVLPDKPRLFEAFAGCGMQRMAFNRLGLDYEMIGVSEIDKYALKSYMAIHGETKNYGSITDIKGTDLPQIDVFTWSFPCTDLSKAGKQKGLNNTRSGLVYEVLRILHECDLNGNLPKVLIMENVVDLVQTKFIRQFQEIQVELEELGYSNYTQTLNGKDYGVAQNRDRVFMVSILGDYYYEFPKPIPLTKRLKDYLESEVDEKYYLSDKMLSFFVENSLKNQEKGNGFRFKPKEETDIANALTTLAGNRMDDNFIKKPVRLGGVFDEEDKTHQAGSIWDVENLSPTIDTMQGGHRQPCIIVPENTIKGFAEAYEGDGVYLNRPHQKRGVVQDQMIQTLKTTVGNDVGVVVYDDYNSSIRADQDTIGTLTTNCGNDASRNGYKLIENGLRIRKLSPKECFRLMGIDDEDFHKAQKVNSNAQLYKQAGNGLIVDVFAAILKTMVKGE